MWADGEGGKEGRGAWETMGERIVWLSRECFVGDVIVPLCGSVPVCGRDEGSGGHKPGVCFDVQL